MAALALFGAASLLPCLGHAVVVERIVAVVGDRPILLSELKARARPFLLQISQTAQNSSQRAAAETQALRDVLQRMVDDQLEEQAAERARIHVSLDEIDNAIANVAAQAGLTPKQLLEEVRRRGLTEQEYRGELRRQLLEGKLVQLRLRGRVRITEEDARAAYAQYVREISQESPVDLRMIALRLDPARGEEGLEERAELAESIAERARQGTDYCELVRAHSDDNDTLETCGSRGEQPLSNMVPQLRELVESMQPGDVAGPIRFGNEALVVFQLAGRASAQPYAKVREQMYARATNQALEKQKRAWLGELRRAAYVDVRY